MLHEKVWWLHVQGKYNANRWSQIQLKLHVTEMKFWGVIEAYNAGARWITDVRCGQLTDECNIHIMI